MDSLSKEQRSKQMTRIRSSNTKPERYIRSELHKAGYRFFVKYHLPFGKPDIYFPRRKVAIFIHGCFWHRHAGCTLAYNPKSNVDFWKTKFAKNVERDNIVRTTLHHLDIRVGIIWECTIRKMMKNDEFRDNTLHSLYEFIEAGSGYLEL